MGERWIKLDVSLIDKPQVSTIAAKLGVSKVHVCGALFRTWALVDEHGDSDAQKRHAFLAITPEGLDVEVMLPGFGKAMMSVGWAKAAKAKGENGSLVDSDGSAGLWFPDYFLHNGPTNKARAQNARRQAWWRNGGSPNVTSPSTPVTPKRYDGVTEEERRGEETPPPYSPPPSRQRYDTVTAEKVSEGEGVGDSGQGAQEGRTREELREIASLLATRGVSTIGVSRIITNPDISLEVVKLAVQEATASKLGAGALVQCLSERATVEALVERVKATREELAAKREAEAEKRSRFERKVVSAGWPDLATWHEEVKAARSTAPWTNKLLLEWAKAHPRRRGRDNPVEVPLEWEYNREIVQWLVKEHAGILAGTRVPPGRESKESEESHVGRSENME